MLELAIESGIPIIEAHTTDLVNVHDILQHITGAPFERFQNDNPTLHKYSYTFGELSKPTPEALYGRLVQKECVLVIINSENPSLTSFKAGVVPTPPQMAKELLGAVLNEQEVDALLPSLSGLTLKDIGEVARITMARDGSLTTQGLTKTRRAYINDTKGIAQVPTTMGFYQAQPALAQWCEVDGKFFHESPHSDLVPRGLLFAGGAGLGKTLGAKYIASRLEVPLYRLNVGNMMGKYVGECHVDDTEFLTERGWRLFDKVDSRLATVNMGTHTLEYQEATARHSNIYTGTMVKISGKRHDAVVTPNHDMYLQSPNTGSWGKIKAGEINTTQRHTLSSAPNWSGVEKATFKVPIHKAEKPDSRRILEYPMDTFLEFLGYFISEGSTETKKRGLIALSQNRGVVADRIIACMKVVFNRVWVVEAKGSNLNIAGSNAPLWDWLREHCGSTARNKRVPPFVKYLSKRQIAIFWDAIIAGDGSYDKKGRAGACSYTSTSKGLTEDLTILAVHLGYTSKSRDVPAATDNHLPQRAAYFYPTANKKLYKKHVEDIAYSGRVVCFTVPNGTLITRRGGHVMVSGNSEGNMMTALAQVDNEAPAVLLIDEVEKVFNSKEDNGVQFRLLSQLLWWLQEHKSKVLTLMTTNDVDALPPELYREGRIDKVLTFEGMSSASAAEFSQRYIKSLGLKTEDELFATFGEGNNKVYTPAEVVQVSLDTVKEYLLS